MLFSITDIQRFTYTTLKCNTPLPFNRFGFWQALGLLLLCRILFGGLGHGGPRRHGGRGFRGRCRNMSPEEREKFRKVMEEGYGFGRTDEKASQES